MLRIGQAVLIKMHVFCQDLNFQFVYEMPMYYGEAGMRIERCRENFIIKVIYMLLENDFLQHFRDER